MESVGEFFNESLALKEAIVAALQTAGHLTREQLVGGVLVALETALLQLEDEARIMVIPDHFGEQHLDRIAIAN
ncbi:hypothetical protein [Rhizobium alvei]|uniref:Uncharacterized protein n=1 Tax=Rhizobium alvei TaxID=1132659 RepID=A0ABT8YJI5_9HYPH|nr:hypothetical protein [Rhizobium alvei]MDO6963868.1 hypothetical protein [Rhizobium alvei]